MHTRLHDLRDLSHLLFAGRKGGCRSKMYPKSHPKFEGFAPFTAEMAGEVSAKKGEVYATCAIAPTGVNIEKTGKNPFLIILIKMRHMAQWRKWRKL